MKNAGKKTLIILLCMIALCSCSSHDSSNCGDKSSSVQDSMLSDSSYDTLKEYPEREQKQNDIVYYTDEEAISIIQENTSFSRRYLCKQCSEKHVSFFKLYSRLPSQTG